MSKPNYYDLDGIERDLRAEIETWDWPSPATINRTPEQLTVIQDGLFACDPIQVLQVSADGWCELHWSFPKGDMVKQIVDRHASSTPSAAQEDGDGI